MPPPRNKRVLLLQNVKERLGGGVLEPVRARLGAGGFAVTEEPFENFPEIARDITRRQHSSDVIVVCVGDGSISSPAPAVIESGLPLGIIPAGTANDLARTLPIRNVCRSYIYRARRRLHHHRRPAQDRRSAFAHSAAELDRLVQCGSPHPLQ